MLLDQKGNVCGGMKFGDECSVEECICFDGKVLVEFDDFTSGEGCDDDIVNLLPNDPFGMEFNLCLPNDPFGMELDIEATVAATVAGLMEELKARGFESDEASEDKSIDDDHFWAELNLVWTGSLKFEQGEEENALVDTGSKMHSDDGSCDAQSMFLDDDMEDLIWFGWERYQYEPVEYCKNADGSKDCDNADGDAPAALFFALRYLGVRDLLSVEMVCRSLRDAVRHDSLLWRSIDIDSPLNWKITNDILLRLTNRAEGMLCSMDISKCSKITNAGLKHVLGSNSGLTKLSVAGCIGLSIEGVLDAVKAFNSSAQPGIKHLRIAELYGLTNEHFNEFKLLLGVDEDKKSCNYKPRFYHTWSYILLDDERAIDIETCPRCQEASQVYDCPAESCQVHSKEETCRACCFCVERCIGCGCCLNNKEHEETFSLELLCLDCWAYFLNKEKSVALSSKHTYYCQKGTYQFLLFS